MERTRAGEVTLLSGLPAIAAAIAAYLPSPRRRCRRCHRRCCHLCRPTIARCCHRRPSLPSPPVVLPSLPLLALTTTTLPSPTTLQHTSSQPSVCLSYLPLPSPTTPELARSYAVLVPWDALSLSLHPATDWASIPPLSSLPLSCWSPPTAPGAAKPTTTVADPCRRPSTPDLLPLSLTSPLLTQPPPLIPATCHRCC